MIIINFVSKQEMFLHWGGDFQGQFKQAGSPEVMEMSLSRVIPRRCCPGCAVQSCVGRAPCTRGGQRVPCVILEGWAAALGCDHSRAVLEGEGEQGEMCWAVGAVWGRAGSVWDSTGTVPGHPSTSFLLLLCPGLSMLGLQH